MDPIFNLYNDKWPIYTASHNLPPAKFVFADQDEQARGQRHGLAGVRGLHHLRRPGEPLDPLAQGARATRTRRWRTRILFENVTIGRRCRIRRAIIDKNVEIPPGMTIGYDLEEDKRRFHVTADGVVVIPKGMKVS